MELRIELGIHAESYNKIREEKYLIIVSLTLSRLFMQLCNPIIFPYTILKF